MMVFTIILIILMVIIDMVVFPSILQMILLPICPESPRYLLISKGQEQVTMMTIMMVILVVIMTMMIKVMMMVIMRIVMKSDVDDVGDGDEVRS